MIKYMHTAALGLFAAAVGAAACASPEDVADEADALTGDASKPIVVDQGWDAATRAKFNHANPGFELMPMAWFLALEDAKSTAPFAGRLAEFGFLPSDAPANANPHRLPVGFGEDENEETKPLYGDSRWIGVTCAACHSSEVLIKGKHVRIDGGPNMVRFMEFQREILTVVTATLRDGAKFDRFARAVGAKDSVALRRSLGKFASDWGGRVARNPDYQENGQTILPGPGRLDGLGTPINETMCKLAELGNADLRAQIEDPKNCTGNQPSTSLPHMWGITKMEFVQWAGNVHATLGRNVGALNALSMTWVEKGPLGPVMRSTAKLRTLHETESWLEQLKPPSWRKMAAQGLVPPLKEDLVAKGRKLYGARCESCHAVQPELTAPNKGGYRYWKVPVFSPSEIGTDTAVLDVANGRVATLPPVFVTPFKLLFGAGAIGPNNAVPANAYRALLITNMIANGLPRETLSPIELAQMVDCRDNVKQPKVGYKSRTLEGIGFTAPYLHNGSVPTLDDLLKPASQRPKTFRVGCRTLDTERLGIACTEADASFVFDTSLPTNHNVGHEFGTDLDPADRAALIEYVKSLEEPKRAPLPLVGACKF